MHAQNNPEKSIPVTHSITDGEQRMQGKLEMLSHHGFSEVPDHRLEEMLLVVGHVVPVVMLLPLHANPAVLVQVLHTL